MGRRLYSGLFYALSPLVWKRVWREQLPGRSRAERLGRIPDHRGQRVLWVHAASVGEVVTAAPVIRALIDDNPEHRVVVTTMTATGAERVAALFGSEVSHYFIALDFPAATRRMVRLLDPELLVIVETELWPNLIHAAADHHVPIALINARITERGFKRYQRFKRLVGDMLIRINWAAVKSGEDGKRFRALGLPVKRITVAGALKFDLEVDDATRALGEVMRERIGPRPVWIAASTHDGEERAALEAHARLRSRYPEALLILVPRHPQRFDAVAGLCIDQLGAQAVARRSHDDAILAATQVYLGDTMGELMGLYACAEVAFVGGTLVPIGGHNLLEPAALGVAVLSGPQLANLSEIADALARANARIEIDDAASLGDTLVELFDDPAQRRRLGAAARGVVEANRGAKKLIRDHLLAMIPLEPRERRR
ncbi:lipid IV(A) 3-deoxy-D-manno-octulosonic acid transferase [Halotalea alkalilenta]|uniref:lipid IV(A) 3-deoxy-D-manno-octulosonic acid transferase n=1 Tax=Halotalea alkalilenta TaxID=376489 RepID=UPI0009EE0E72|nr:lipid IV(A) 3-deoxy-D-manno-octulosonic acid transferase [Halotalea alkalilenta]